MADATCAGCGCACDDIEVTRTAGSARTCPLGDAVVRRARRRAAAGRQRRRPRGERRRGRGRRGRDPASGARAARLRPGPDELRGAAPGGGARRGGRGGDRRRRFGAGRTRRSARARPPSARSATGPSSSCSGAPTRSSPIRACWGGCGSTPPRSSSSTRSARPPPSAAGAFVEVDDDFDALWALRARIREDALDDLAGACSPHATSPSSTARSTSSPRWRCSRSCATSARDRHAVTLGLRGDGNARGAEDVLAWQTGFAAAVSFARGFPRESPRAAELLERGEVDAALVVAADPLEDLPRLRGLPTVVVDARETATSQAARVAFATAADGIEVAGTVHRMDGVPVPLRAPWCRGAPGRRGRAGRDRRAPLMLRIAGGRVYDPANGIAGEVRDVCVRGRQDRRRRAGARPPDRRARDGRHAGRRRHPRPHRRAGGQRRAQARARGAPRRRARAHRDRALRHRRHRPLDVRHRLPLRAARLHDRRRGRDAAARRPAHARRAPRHAGHRRRLPRADGQQPAALRAHPHRARPRARGDRLVARRPPAATASSSSIPAASRCGSAATAT